jgi:hypothetical protein
LCDADIRYRLFDFVSVGASRRQGLTAEQKMVRG